MCLRLRQSCSCRACRATECCYHARLPMWSSMPVVYQCRPNPGWLPYVRGDFAQATQPQAPCVAGLYLGRVRFYARQGYGHYFPALIEVLDWLSVFQPIKISQTGHPLFFTLECLCDHARRCRQATTSTRTHKIFSRTSDTMASDLIFSPCFTMRR